MVEAGVEEHGRTKRQFRSSVSRTRAFLPPDGGSGSELT
jgi:hypothetical protein